VAFRIAFTLTFFNWYRAGFITKRVPLHKSVRPLSSSSFQQAAERLMVICPDTFVLLRTMGPCRPFMTQFDQAVLASCTQGCSLPNGGKPDEWEALRILLVTGNTISICSKYHFFFLLRNICFSGFQFSLENFRFLPVLCYPFNRIIGPMLLS